MVKILSVEKGKVNRRKTGSSEYPTVGSHKHKTFYLLNTDGEVVTKGMFESIDDAIGKLNGTSYSGQFYLQQHASKEKYKIQIGG